MRKVGILVLLLCSHLVGAQTPAIWTDYVNDKAAGEIPGLLDYSYAGYHFSEKEIPDISGWTQFDVTDYGAVADDELFDEDEIQAAIDAAQAFDGPAVVFFPSGKFLVSDDNDIDNSLLIDRDSIVLKGSGSGDGGTEIFMKEKRVKNGHWQFVFKNPGSGIAGSTFITADVLKGEFSIEVNDASGFGIGEVIKLGHKSTAFAESHFGELELNEADWTRLFGFGGGMNLHELHEIIEINGTKIVFKNPIQTDLPKLEVNYVVSHYPTIQEVGVEDILFTSDWGNYDEDFEHHKDDIHDYAWSAMRFEDVRNAWVRNCEFKDWNEVLEVRESIGVTVENVVISGKKGHASFLTRRGYGLLVKDCDDQAGQHHGPGTGYAGVNTVYLRHKMKEDQSVDSHSGQPYATLLDDVDGGVMNKNGGPYESYPHHGQDFTFWNFIHKSSKDEVYDFWNAENRNSNTYAHPHFIGFQPNDEVVMLDEGINQNLGERVSPASLFEAQLELRLEESSTKPEVTWVTPNHGDQLVIGTDLEVIVNASDPDGTITKAVLYINDLKQREITTAPYTWGVDESLDQDLFGMSAGAYVLKVEAFDNDANVVIETIEIEVGKSPIVAIETPTLSYVHVANTTLVMEAIATDEDGTVESVSLYLDEVLVSTLTAAPYKWESIPTLDDLEGGRYVLKVEAIDNDQLSSSVEQDLLVNESPIVSFASPEDGAEFEYGTDLRVEVNATDVDGTVSEALLYLNDELQRKEPKTPYVWGERIDFDPDLFGLTDGVYELKTVAVDDRGTESSATIKVTILEKEEILIVEKELDSFFLYPNPCENELVISTEQAISQFIWMDASGRVLSYTSYDGTQTKVSIDTTSYIKGFYFVRLVTIDGDQSMIKVLKK